MASYDGQAISARPCRGVELDALDAVRTLRPGEDKITQNMKAEDVYNARNKSWQTRSHKASANSARPCRALHQLALDVETERHVCEACVCKTGNSSRGRGRKGKAERGEGGSE